MFKIGYNQIHEQGRIIGTYRWIPAEGYVARFETPEAKARFEKWCAPRTIHQKIAVVLS